VRPVLLKAGRAFVPAERVPVLLARAIYPPSDDKGRLSPAIGRLSAKEEHAKAARRAANLGELPVVDHAGLPTIWSPRARVRVADFIAYAARFEVAVTVADAGPKPLQEWTDEEVEKTRQSALAASRVMRIVEEGDRAMRVLDALFASDEPMRTAGQKASTVSKLPDADRAAAPVPAVVAQDTPLPLTTSDIAFCFDGLRYSEAKWKKPLGNKPKWLAACVEIPGRRGVSETRWNPVLLGGALVQRGHVSANRVRARFQQKPMLKPWLDAWKTYEAEYIESA